MSDSTDLLAKNIQAMKGWHRIPRRKLRKQLQKLAIAVGKPLLRKAFA